MIAIVGVGIAKGHITERGKNLIKKADIIYGSKKAIELVKEYINCEVVVIDRFCRDTYKEIENSGVEKNVVVLSTGDPMVSGLGLKVKADIVESGISSVQVALARLGLNLCDVVVVDCHAKKCFEVVERVKSCKLLKMLILATKGTKIKDFAAEAKRVVILENLCKENEKIFEADKNFVVSSNETIVYLSF